RTGPAVSHVEVERVDLAEDRGPYDHADRNGDAIGGGFEDHLTGEGAGGQTSSGKFGGNHADLGNGGSRAAGRGDGKPGASVRSAERRCPGESAGAGISYLDGLRRRRETSGEHGETQCARERVEEGCGLRSYGQ